MARIQFLQVPTLKVRWGWGDPFGVSTPHQGPCPPSVLQTHPSLGSKSAGQAELVCLLSIFNPHPFFCFSPTPEIGHLAAASLVPCHILQFPLPALPPCCLLRRAFCPRIPSLSFSPFILLGFQLFVCSGVGWER